MRLLLSVVILLLAGAATAAPIQAGMTVTEFFGRLEFEAKELAEGGMELNRIRCAPDGTLCQALYGAGTSVAAEGRSGSAGMEKVTVMQELPGETEDFWLTSALVMDILDGDFKTVPERSQMILGAMRNPAASAFIGNVGRYTFDRSEKGLFRLNATAK